MQKIAIVTGGSAGIGLATVKKFLDNDYLVYNLDITPSIVGHFIKCDLRDGEQVMSHIESIGEEHGRIDALICNAGIHFSGNIEDTSEEDFDRVFDINVKGAYWSIKGALPSMKSNQQGAIVIIGSDQSMIAKGNSFAYNLSKHALASMAKTTALDYASYNIRVNALCPGTIETPLYHKAIDNYCLRSGANKAQVHSEEEALQPLGRLGQPEEVANFAYFLASDEAGFITGSLQTIDGGYTTQ
ncbi:SDR family oxidoreductase [Psychrobium sp. MM17-31]|uniref:SDR family NAD(P)-dependent oxidoreductase n=1 Tax=Psychrobium sp. MM17-31 TaxID=2917758 RepID=UPI001EF612CB|nr:SDR family oxidoreductase [Psychrobium sp. MM17-31]